MKSIICISMAIIALFILTLSGCGEEELNEEIGYNYEEIAEIEIGQVLKFALHNDNLILVGMYTTLGTKAVTLDLECNILSEVILTGYSILADVDPQGRIWVLTTDGADDHYVIACYDSAGNNTKIVKIGKQEYISNLSTLVVGISPEEEVFFCIRVGGNAGNLLVFDENGERLLIDGKPRNNIRDLFKVQNGRVYYRLAIENKSLTEPLMSIDCLCLKCDVECIKIERAHDKALAKTSRYQIINGNSKYDFLMVSRGDVYGSNLAGKRTELVNWMAEGVDNADFSMYKHTVLAEDSLYTLAYLPPPEGGYSSAGKIKVIRLQKAEFGGIHAQTKAKTVIHATSLYSNVALLSAVVNFNKISSDYRIELKVYSEDYFHGVASDAINTFHIDLVTGEIPDMVFLARNMPYQSYSAKGLFANLYEFMDNDPDIKRDDYLQNIFRLLESDGKLYTATTSFLINTLVGKAADFGDRHHLTWNEYTTFLDGRQDVTLPIGIGNTAMTKDQFLSVMLIPKMTDFVDFKEKLCYFENPDFLKLLIETDRFPLRTEDYQSMIDYKNGNPPLSWMPNMLAFYPQFYPHMVQLTTFSEEMVYVGFPTDGKNGSSCAPNDLFAIMADAKEKEGAWAFVKYLLTDFQETAGSGLEKTLSGFPIKVSVLEKLALETKNPKYYEDVSIPDADGHLIPAKPPTDEEVKKVLDMLYSLAYLDTVDDKITEIVLEEAPFYYTGQKTPEQVAAVIQNRVSLYLKELE